jgi:hypothetical protein
MRSISTLLMAVLALTLWAPAAVRAQGLEWEAPSAQASITEPVTFQATFQAEAEPERVELVLSIPGQRAVSVVVADVAPTGDRWQATATLTGHTPPNTVIDYHFRARGPDGFVEGPSAQVRLVHEGFDWRTIAGPTVRLHWYEGDEAFAQRALDIGEESVRRASELLGVTESEPIDFFIYADQAAMYEALGAGTRENVGGQAHSDIRTMFGLIEPHEISSDWVDTLVSHELTHLVFDTATANPFRQPPRWLNEGVAVYLSEGYTPGWRATVDRAADGGTLIPLDGLGGLFPTTADEFRLAYGISVSAIDFFVRSYTEETLWQLVRSYAEGVSDDDAFVAATGADLATFNEAWMRSLGAEVPEPFGPIPAPTGPIPPGWEGAPGPAPLPTDEPGQTAAPVPAPTPVASPRPDAPAQEGLADGVMLIALAALGVLVVGVLVGIVLVRRSRPRQPPPPWS